VNLPFEAPSRDDVTAMLRLAGPVVVVQVGLMMMGVVDIMVVGRVSANALAAVALGHVSVMSVVSMGMGILMVVDPLVSQAMGARDRLAVRRTFQRCLLMAAVIAVPVILVLIPVEPVLVFLRQPEETVPIAAGYVHRVLPGLVPFFGFIVLRQTLQAMERMRPIVLTIVVANGLNLVLDLALVHGMWGFPALGPLGSAWATTLSRLTLFVGLGIAAYRVLFPLVAEPDREAFRIAPLIRTFKLGLPIGIQLLLEFTSVSAIALLMGGMGAIAMAAHQVSINLAALAFMVPLGLSAASAVRVGHAVGRDDLHSARRSTTAALMSGGGSMLVIAALFLSVPRLLASAYTPEPDVLDLAQTLIPIAGIFLVFDAFQIIAAGVLRGMGDTRAPMLIVLFGFWLIGMPVSVLLAFRLGLGPQGLWWGFVAGLAVVAPLLMLRIAAKLSRPLVRVSVE
jgi:MATE family multidrug resistance protein